MNGSWVNLSIWFCLTRKNFINIKQITKWAIGITPLQYKAATSKGFLIFTYQILSVPK